MKVLKIRADELMVGDFLVLGPKTVRVVNIDGPSEEDNKIIVSLQKGEQVILKITATVTIVDDDEDISFASNNSSRDRDDHDHS